MKMTFQEFENVLLYDDYKYSAREIRHLFNAVKSMNSKTRLWVIKWILKGEFPSEEVEGITAEQLMKEYGFRPMNAFIVLDWLQTDPQAAKYFIMKMPVAADISEAVVQEMTDYLQENNIAATPVLNDEESGDLVE